MNPRDAAGRTPSGPTTRRRIRRLWRTRVLAHRRLLAAGCVALGVAVGLQVLAPAGPATEQVLVAARDLPAGTVLAPDDLVRAAWPEETGPEGAATHAVGRTLAAPLRRGEPVTDLRLVSPDLVEGYPGRVALPVRIPDPDAVGLLAVGDRVDLVATDPESATAAVVAREVPVVALPSDASASSGQGTAGRLVVLAVAPGDLEEVSVAAVRHFLTIAFSG